MQQNISKQVQWLILYYHQLKLKKEPVVCVERTNAMCANQVYADTHWIELYLEVTIYLGLSIALRSDREHLQVLEQ